MSINTRSIALIVILSFFPLQNLWSDNGVKINSSDFDDSFYNSLLEANDKSVTNYIELQTQIRGRGFRGLGEEFAILVSSYTQKKSKHYKSDAVRSRLNEIADKLLSLQYPDGTLDSGGNRQSPPDTGFSLDHLCPAAALLNQLEDEELKSIKTKLESFLKNAANGIASGGVHTTNHRWVVSSALTRCYALYNNNSYLKRVDEWLAEGIYIDDDGMFPERSPNYSEVVDKALLNIGHILNRPYLFEYVKKNLLTTYYLMEENGEVQTIASRRQDQNYLITITRNYLFYRYLSIYFNDGELAGIARKIETFDDFSETVLSRSLIYFLDNEILRKKLPESKKPDVDFEKVFPQTGLVRIKKDNVSATIFGGNDKPVIIASGRSWCPDFFKLRKGEASLNYVRLSTSFFSTGFFRSDGVQKEDSNYVLKEKKEAFYYKPMPEKYRNQNGDYELSPSLDGRYWSKMDFEKRPVDTKTLETEIRIKENDKVFTMEVEVTGNPGVNVTMDFCFKEGGKLDGAKPAKTNSAYYFQNDASGLEDNYFFDEEYVKYSFGNDMIQIGPGKTEHNNISRLEGELYRYHNGSIKGEGLHVYFTGITPFKHTITIK